MSKPSLALIPCAYDTGKLYSVLPDTGAGDFTVSRNGNATYFDKDGILRTALRNEPRFDFDPLTGQFRGVLVESNATNVLLNSETPATQTLLMTVAQRTISFYGSGTVTLSGAFSATITGNVNPLIRTTFTFTPTATNLTITPSGNVTRYQLELGPVATSYIPTSGSQVLRPTDDIRRTNAQDLIGQTEGSVIVDFIPRAINSNVLGLRNSTGVNEGVLVEFDSASRIDCFLAVNNIQGVVRIMTNLLPPNNRYRVAFGYKSGDNIVYINGQLVGQTSQVFQLTNILTQIRLHSSWNFAGPNVHNLNTIIYKTRLSNTELQALSAL